MWMRKNNQRKGEKLGVGTATHTPKEKMRHREEVQKKEKQNQVYVRRHGSSNVANVKEGQWLL